MMTGSSRRKKEDKKDGTSAIKVESKDKEKSVDCGASWSTTARGDFSLVAPFRK